ncbi:MAG: CAP domain-containing protein [Candidatus Absconditabacterales bacterium]
MSLGTTFASFSADDFIAQFQTKQSTLSLAEKKTYYLQVYNNLSLLAVRNRSDAEQIKLYTSLREYVSTQIKNLGSSASYLTSLSFSGMNISKVDLTKVRDVWLALHNIERSTKSLTSFTYSSALEGTASTWANHLAELGRTSHQRKNTDGYYSYNSIKTWFLDQGIVFATEEKNGQSLFTENLGRGYYTCKKADCTEDFIKAIKTSRAFFIKEKGKSYRPHYNAIMGDFSIIGLGVALVGSKYYLVSHYTQDLK